MKINDLEMAGTAVQGSLEWRRARLGRFTASTMADLMSTGRSKTQLWGERAVTKMAEVAAERALRREVVDNDLVLTAVLDFQCYESAAMRHGREWEATARSRYEAARDRTVATCGLLLHPRVAGLACSPDGCLTDAAGEIEGLIEVKCPSTLKTWMRYRWNIADGASLKREKAECYWQVQTEMAVTGARWTDVVTFCPWVEGGLSIARVERDEADIRALEERVVQAEGYIREMNGKRGH